MNKTNKYICIILTPMFLIYSCTFTYKKSKRDSIDTYYEKIHSYSERFTTYLILKSEEEYEVNNLNVKVDSTSYTVIGSYKSTKISTSEIKCVEFRDATTGAIGGMLIGLLGGLAIGLAALYLLPEGGGHPDMSGFVVVYAILLGAPLGFIIGAIKEDKKIYYLDGSL